MGARACELPREEEAVWRYLFNLCFASSFMDLNASPPPTGGFPAADPLSIEKEGSVKAMEEKTPAGQPIVDREKVRQTVLATTDSPLNHSCQTAPFLIRA